MGKKRTDALDVLLPQAVRLRLSGMMWAEVGREVGRGLSTLDRWSKRPEWRAEVRKYHAEQRKLEREAEEDRKAIRERRVKVMGGVFEKLAALVADALDDPDPAVARANALRITAGASGLRTVADMAEGSAFVLPADAAGMDDDKPVAPVQVGDHTPEAAQRMREQEAQADAVVESQAS